MADSKNKDGQPDTATAEKIEAQANDASASPLVEATDKGYFGQRVDPAPESAYTVDGVTSGEPTPETDDELAAEARARALLSPAQIAEREGS